MENNINLAECIVKQEQWGQTLISNICSGSSQTLPWQLGDWFSAFAVGGAVVVLGGVFLTIALIGISSARGY